MRKIGTLAASAEPASEPDPIWEDIYGDDARQPVAGPDAGDINRELRHLPPADPEAGDE